MIYLELFLGFLRVGCFAFGGGYGAVPLIRDVVLSYGWMNEEALTTMIAVSESTPGPIMVNLATYVGSVQGGLPGALLATFAVVLPAFFILIAVVAMLKRIIQNEWVQAMLRGVQACVIGLILATGATMTIRSCLPADETPMDWRAPVLTAVLACVAFGVPKWLKRKISPIQLIVIAAILGIAFYGV